jgi:hypothetical protein
MIAKKEIIYPIFLECSQYAEDTFWINIFEDLAYGKTPYGTYINKDFLCCKYKNKEFNYKIEKKNSKELYDDIYNLFANKLGLLSQIDKINQKIDFYNLEEEIKSYKKSWVNIKKKNIKDLFIENYVIEMRNKYNLTLKQSKFLLSIIFIGMIFKVFSIKDINYEDGKITSIEGINFKKKNVIIEKNIYNIEPVLSPIIVIENNLLSDNWPKYLEKLKKNNKV